MERKMTQKQRQEEFEKVVRPVIEFLCKNYHPHCTIIIDQANAELLEGEIILHTEDYIQD
jgi:hypothetical protein